MALLAPTTQQLPVGRNPDTPIRMPAPILLNSAAARQYAFTLSAAPTHQQRHPHHNSLSANSSASSTMSSTSETSASNAAPTQPAAGVHPTGRRIIVKFAPLPDPRKLEEDELENGSITSDSEEQMYDDLRKGSGGAAGLLRISSYSASAGDLAGGGGASPSVADSPRSSPRWSTKRLLRPLLPKGSGAAGGDGGLDGESSLYRASSKDSIHSTQSTTSNHGRALSSIANFRLGSKHRSASDLETHQRGRSSSASSSTTPTLLSKMSPLTHTTSESAALSRTTSNNSTSGPIRRTRSQSTNASSAVGGANAKRHFMLNGRVYGSRRGALTPNTNDPFSHQRAYEQEFVEWGSGGLGAVPASRAQGAAADWNRVTAGGTTFTGKTAPAAKAAAEEEDDGSGLTWVRKRREAREKARQEEEEAAKQRQKEQKASDKAAVAEKEATPTVTDNPRADDPPGSETAADHGEAISRPHSSATIRNRDPIPEIVIDSAQSPENSPSLSSFPAHTTSPPPSASATPPASSSSPPPLHEKPNPLTHDSRRSSTDSHREHKTDLAVVPPRPSHHHVPRRTTSGTQRHALVSDDIQPHHPHPLSKDVSADMAELGAGPDEGERDKEESTLRHRAASPPPAPAAHRTDSSTSSTGSTNSSTTSDPSGEEDEEEADEKDDDDDENEDEDESETQRRLTAECAGVEKITRHRERRA